MPTSFSTEFTPAIRRDPTAVLPFEPVRALRYRDVARPELIG
jgi:hypothetical protein